MLILFLYVRSANTVPLHIEIGMRILFLLCLGIANVVPLHIENGCEILFLLCSFLEAFGDA